MTKLLFFLLEEDGRFLTVKNGVITPTADPTPLPNSPDGWIDTTLAWQRDLKLWGLGTSLSLPYGFLFDGAYILRKALFAESLGRRVYLTVCRHEIDIDLTGGTYDHVYRKIFCGLLNSTSFKHSFNKLESTITDGGLMALYNANKSTQFEFLLSEGDATVVMDGLNVYGSKRYSAIDGIKITDSGKKNFTVPYFSGTGGEGNSTGLYFQDQTGEQIGPFNPYITSSDNYFLWNQNNYPVDILTEGKLIAKIDLNVGEIHPKFYIQKSGGGRLDASNLSAYLAAPFPKEGETIEAIFNGTITLGPGEKAFLIADLSNNIPLPVAGVTFLPNSNLTFRYKTRYKTTYAPAYTLLALYKRLVKAIAGKDDYALSTLLAANPQLKITSGDGLRNIAKAKLKISLDTFLEICRVNLFAGFGIEKDRMMVEGLRHFLKTSNPLYIGEVSPPEIYPADDLIFTTVRYGYNATDTDDVNGKYSFANSYTFKTPLTIEAKELTLISPAIADPYAIELMRTNLDGKDTTDSSTDNKVYLLDAPGKRMAASVYSEQVNGINYLNINDPADINDFTAGHSFTVESAGTLNGTYTIVSAVKLSGAVQVIVRETVPQNVFPDAVFVLSASILYRSATAVITGVPDPETIFNLRLSPRNILIRWLPYLNSCLHKEEGMALTYVTTEKNADLKVIDGGVTIEEKADIVIGRDRIFLALYLSFSAPMPEGLPKLLENDPNLSLSCSVSGDVLTGIIIKNGLSINDEKEQSVKLLSAPDNNFKNFIYGG